MAYTWGVTKWDDPPSSEAPSWRDACERSLGTHPTPGPPSRICHFVGLRRFSHLFSLSEQFENCTRSLFFWEKNDGGNYVYKKARDILQPGRCDHFFWWRMWRLHRAVRNKRKERRCPTVWGSFFLLAPGESLVKIPELQFLPPLETNMTPEK